MKKNEKNVQSEIKRKNANEAIHTHARTHNRVGTGAAAATIKAYILRKILYAKSKVERKSLWLKCLGKNCDILMKLLMLFFSRILFTFFSLSSQYMSQCMRVAGFLKLHSFFLHFFTLVFISTHHHVSLVDKNRRWKIVYRRLCTVFGWAP